MLIISEAFDDTIPLRTSLSEIARALSCHAESELRLPVYEPGEDFIDGTLHFGPYALDVYFEHSLGYFQLTYPDQVALDTVWAILTDAVVVE